METVEEAQVPVPSVVEDSLSVTVLPVRQETVKVGVLSDVLLSVEEEPVSEASVRFGVPGASEGVVVIVIERPEEAEETLPAGSVWVAVTL